MKRQDYFQRPELVRQIIGERTVYTPAKESLVDAIEGLKKNEAVVIDYALVPEQYRDETHFLKRGDQVNLKRYETIDDAINDAKPMWRLRKEAFQNIGDKEYCGYGFWGIRKREHKKVHLVDCIKGAKLLAFSIKSDKQKDQINVRKYEAAYAGKQRGGKYLVEVPSMTEDKKYLVDLENVPFTRKRNKYSIIFDLSTRHGCEAFIANAFHYRYSGSELAFCPHVIAAYHKLAKEEWEKGNKTPMEVNPFAIPTKDTVDFYNKLTSQVMVKESYKDDEGKERTKKRPLNKAEKEILLWKRVAKKGAMATFFSTSKIDTYEW
ncbi:hypothetical protein KY311_00020 [Candidatus Woesearchaeota archaeon]|nr:hypothetical protein [Candidatus Woesearchaeota archaeon]